jgi:pyridoxamine 5'-phosphate oxidase
MSDAKKEAMEFLIAHNIALLTTVDGDTPYSRVMMTPKIDEDFSLWFTTSSQSNKVKHIVNNPKTCTTFHEGAKWVRILGKAEVIKDAKTKQALWQDEWKRYFPKGADDPDYTVIKVTPNDIEYNDIEKGMMPQKIM